MQARAAEAVAAAEARARAQAAEALGSVASVVEDAQTRLKRARELQRSRAYELPEDARLRYEWPALLTQIQVRMHPLYCKHACHHHHGVLLPPPPHIA